MKLSTTTGKDARIQTCGPSLLKHQNFRVHHEHELVFVNFKGVEIKMDYPTALKLAQMIYGHAKQAKKFAGDYSKRVDAIGVLTDAEQHERLNFR